MSMAAPLGVLAACPAAATTEVEDVDGGPLGGAEARGPGAPTKTLRNVDDGPSGGAGAGGPGAPTFNAKKR
jgi:uncharacterized membrane protein